MTPEQWTAVHKAADARRGTPEHLTEVLRQQLSRGRSFAACEAYEWDGSAADGELLYLGEPKSRLTTDEARAVAYVRSMVPYLPAVTCAATNGAVR